MVFFFTPAGDSCWEVEGDKNQAGDWAALASAPSRLARLKSGVRLFDFHALYESIFHQRLVLI